MVPSNDPDQIASNVTVTPPTTLDKVHGLADAVRNYDADPAYAGEARHVRRYGSMDELIKHRDEVADVINAASSFFTPETAPAAGVELTVEDLSALANRTDAQGHVAQIEASKPGAFEGDMVGQADTPTGGQSRPAGAPWTGAQVKYCFGSDASAGARRAFYGAVAQVRKAVPCIAFSELGLKGDGAACDHAAEEKSVRLPPPLIDHDSLSIFIAL